ncbi:accessory gene regulator B family protein [Cohnella massiliensis]|uniref:accessory gene regulator B family protein n=1 Tax=Cohnella massiliensis TaxID=1816691 RepID=UPI00159495F5|nr:accessory gene regulator B family protein [Cohnella massiliensis]
MKRNGADPSVSERTLRFALMLWISMIFIIMLTAAGGIFLGVFSEAIAALAVLGLLRYFSGGWHFKQMDACVIFTAAVAIGIAMMPAIEEIWLIPLNIVSLALVLLLAPTGHGQKFSNVKQKTAFKWISVILVTINFVALNQIAVVSTLFQSLTLITRKGGG